MKEIRKEESSMFEVELEAKSKEESIKLACEKLNASESEIVYHVEEETTGKLFKSSIYKIKATTFTNLVEKVKEYLKEVIVNLGLDVQFESSIRERKINISMYADNNAILIGKDGKTLKALETLAKQKVQNDYGVHVSVSLDVENYKEKKIKNLEYMAKKIAREVRSTKVEATLENMNSFERRVVHNILTDFKGVTTISEGEEPNRHVIIKPTDN